MKLSELTCDEAFEFGIKVNCAARGMSKQASERCVERIKTALFGLDALGHGAGWAGKGLLALAGMGLIGGPILAGNLAGHIGNAAIGARESGDMLVSGDLLKGSEEIEELMKAVNSLEEKEKRKRLRANQNVRSRPMF